MRPTPAEYAPFYETYVSLVSEDDILPALERQPADVRALASTVTADGESYRYAPGRWNVREVIGHIGDAERVFGYRAFCISRGDQAPLPSFDEKAYTANSTFDQCRVAELVDEWAALRETNLIVLRRLPPEAWHITGTASGASVSVRALAYILAGHVRHHVGVLRSWYGLGAAAIKERP